MGRRGRRWGRRLARGGSLGAGFLVRTALVGGAVAWFLDRHQGALRRQRAMTWLRSLSERLHGAGAPEEATGPVAAGGSERPARPPGPPDRDDTREVEGDLRGENASDETKPLRLGSPPVSGGYLGLSWEAEGDSGRAPADDIRTDEDRDRPDVDRHAKREPPPDR